VTPESQRAAAGGRDAPHPGPAFLLLPDRPDRELATILRKVRLLALRTLLRAAPPDASPAERAALGRVQRVLATTAKAKGKATLRAVGAPDVLTPVLCFGGGLCGAGPLLDAVPPLLLALSRAGVLTEAVLWDRPISSLPDPEAGLRYVATPPLQGLLASPEGPSLRTAAGEDLVLGSDGPVSGAVPEGLELRPDYPRIRAGLHLALHDSNPLAMVEAHPDKEGNATSLGGRSAGEWAEAYGAALDAIDAALPAWGAALPLALRRVVPVGFEPERHLSASYREGPGLAYFTLHPSTLTLAEALVHETQHGRLNALNLLDPVFRNGRTAWTPSPVRPDLRPLMGVLLAVHAFVPVAVMHARLALLDHPLSRDPAFARRRAEVLAGNDRGLQICEETADPTALGRKLLLGLRRLHDWCRDHHGASLPKPDENLLG
jgi:HEXXH motif-containing protein